MLCSIDNQTKEVLAFKIIDLEEEEATDEIEDIPGDTNVLIPQCESTYIARYYGSYLKVLYLFITMRERLIIYLFIIIIHYQ